MEIMMLACVHVWVIGGCTRLSILTDPLLPHPTSSSSSARTLICFVRETERARESEGEGMPAPLLRISSLVTSSAVSYYYSA